MKFALMFVLAMVVRGQLAGLVTTGDGAEVEFLSSLGTAGDGATVMRHYRYAPGMPETVFRATDSYPELPFAAVLSDDGATRGTVKVIVCFSWCASGEFTAPFRATVTRNGRTYDFLDLASPPVLSRNGRWLYEVGPSSLGGAALTDLDSGRKVAIASVMMAYGNHAVADDGTVVGFNTGGVVLAGAARVTVIEAPEAGLTSVAISRDGRKVFASTDQVLYEFVQGSGKWRELYQSEGPLGRATPSANGERVLVPSERDVMLFDGGVAKIWYRGDEMVMDSVLSGDGLTAYVTTQSNRLVRIRDGVAEELYMSFPSMGPYWGCVYAGSLVRLGGSAVPEGTEFTVGDRCFRSWPLDRRMPRCRCPGILTEPGSWSTSWRGRGPRS